MSVPPSSETSGYDATSSLANYGEAHRSHAGHPDTTVRTQAVHTQAAHSQPTQNNHAPHQTSSNWHTNSPFAAERHSGPTASRHNNNTTHVSGVSHGSTRQPTSTAATHTGTNDNCNSSTKQDPKDPGSQYTSRTSHEINISAAHTYSMQRWLNESAKEEYWSTEARRR